MNTNSENTMVDITNNNDLKKSFIHNLCIEINHPHSMHLRQYYEDDNDATTMVFCTENSRQFQPSFCHICGNYMSQLNYSGFESISTPNIWCRDELHFKATNKLAILMQIKNAKRSIEHWTKQISNNLKEEKSIVSETQYINTLALQITKHTQNLAQLYN